MSRVARINVDDSKPEERLPDPVAGLAVPPPSGPVAVPPPKRPRGSRRALWIGAGALLLAGAGAGLWFWLKPPDEPPYKQAEAFRGDISLPVLATGTAVPQNRIEVKSPVAGRIERVLVQEGDKVKKGQVLAELSSSERATLLDTARSRGPEEYKKWAEMIKASPVLSPLDGVVIVRNKEPGQTVSAYSDPIVVVANPLVARVTVDETDIAWIAAGQDVKLVADAFPRQPFKGRVQRIAYESQTVNSVTMYQVDVAPTPIPPFLRSGMTINATFPGRHREDVLLVPSAGLQPGRGPNGAVLVLDPKTKKTEKKKVELGLSDAANTEILSGLEEGDVIVWFAKPWGPAKDASKGANPFMPNTGARPPGGGGGGGPRN